MKIERTEDEVIIRIPSSVGIEDLQELIDLIKYKEMTSKFKVDQKEVDSIAREINESWWSKNKAKFIQ
jgi:hypothetical protein